MVKKKALHWVWAALLVLTSCLPGQAAAAVTPTAASACPNLVTVANAFYDANDSGQLVQSLSYLTEDVIMVFWAEGINGHHMGQKVVIGKEQIKDALDDPGLHRVARGPDLPNFTQDTISQNGSQLIFHLTPDRTHPDGRPYDPYVVEMIFSGCRIDILKITERVTWV
jgi:hypothetical protein